MAPFKREIVFDLNFTLLAFYCPYRHTYGNTHEGGNEQDWLDFIVDGIAQSYPQAQGGGSAPQANFADSGTKPSSEKSLRSYSSDGSPFAQSPVNSQILTSGPLPDYGLEGARKGITKPSKVSRASNNPVKSFAALLSSVDPASSDFSLAPHIVADYLRIWNYFLRNPRLVNGQPNKRVSIKSVLDNGVSDDDIPMFGRVTTLLPSMLTALHDEDPSDVNRLLVGLNSESGLVGLDLRNLARGKALMRQQIQKYLMTSQNGASTQVINLREDFQSVHRATFGTSPPVNLIPRPQLIARSSKWASARQIVDNNFDPKAEDNTFGVSIGRMVTNVQLTINRKLIPEHGTVIVLMIPRFAPLIEDEVHFLDKFENFQDYLKMAGDPMSWMETPYHLKSKDVFANGSDSLSLGLTPFGSWYTSHPGFIHPGLYNPDAPYFGRESSGYPFKVAPVAGELSDIASHLANAALDHPQSGYTQSVFRPHFGYPVSTGYHSTDTARTIVYVDNDGYRDNPRFGTSRSIILTALPSTVSYPISDQTYPSDSSGYNSASLVAHGRMSYSGSMKIDTPSKLESVYDSDKSDFHWEFLPLEIEQTSDDPPKTVAKTYPGFGRRAAIVSSGGKLVPINSWEKKPEYLTSDSGISTTTSDVALHAPNQGPHMICHLQHKVLARRVVGEPADAILGGF